jgi:hypothetical protein
MSASALRDRDMWVDMQGRVEEFLRAWLGAQVSEADFTLIETRCTQILHNVAREHHHPRALLGWRFAAEHPYRSPEFQKSKSLRLMLVLPDNERSTVSEMAQNPLEVERWKGAPCIWRDLDVPCGAKSMALVRRRVPNAKPFEIKGRMFWPEVKIALCRRHAELEADACHEHQDCVATEDELGVWHPHPEIGWACRLRANTIAHDKTAVAASAP